jgi:antitoxin VapB
VQHVKLFRVGHSQVLRIPREFELPGYEAVIYREGQRLVLEPIQRPSLSQLLAGWQPIETQWPDVDAKTC